VNSTSKTRIVQACPAEQTGRVYRPDRAGICNIVKCTRFSKFTGLLGAGVYLAAI
jgi:hypothetical protein